MSILPVSRSRSLCTKSEVVAYTLLAVRVERDATFTILK